MPSGTLQIIATEITGAWHPLGLLVLDFLTFQKAPLAYKITHCTISTRSLQDRLNSADATGKCCRARPGFEPGTSRTRSENHTPRPTSQCHSPHFKLIRSPPGIMNTCWVTLLAEHDCIDRQQEHDCVNLLSVRATCLLSHSLHTSHTHISPLRWLSSQNFHTLKYKIPGSSGIWTRDLSHPKRESYP